MTKKPCIECGEQSLVINNEVHFCAPCWIDKFLVNTGDKVDGQPDRKVSGSNKQTLQGSTSKPKRIHSSH